MLSLLPGHFKPSLENTTDGAILFNYYKHVGQATLNRPKALNTVNQDVMTLLGLELDKWNHTSNLKVVIFKGNGGKAFCAGGELKTIYEERIKSNMGYIYSFFRELFTLFYRVKLMKPIQIAFWDGIVIGAGAGFTLNAPIKIATEYTVFSMPEAKIGLFLGIGGGYYFSKMRNYLGYYLGLTSSSFKGKEAVQVGLADFFVKREKLHELEIEILEKTNEKTTIEDLRKIVKTYAEPVENIFEHEELISKVFGKSSVEEIFKELEAVSETFNFAKKMLEAMKLLSPTSLKITFEQLKRGEFLDLKENLKMDYRICHQAFNDPDFVVGVRSVLIEKGNTPQWKPKSVSDITSAEVEKYFATLPEESELKLL